MSKNHLQKEEKEIDIIIDNALIEYQNEINKRDINDWSLQSQESFISDTYEKYISESTKFINNKFPDHPDNIKNYFNNTARFLLYGYASKRDDEFDIIRSKFIEKIDLQN